MEKDQITVDEDLKRIEDDYTAGVESLTRIQQELVDVRADIDNMREISQSLPDECLKHIHIETPST